MQFSGPMFEPPRDGGMEKVISSKDSGAHYSVWHLDSNNGKTDSEIGMDSLRRIFPAGEANDMNFVLFSHIGHPRNVHHHRRYRIRPIEIRR